MNRRFADTFFFVALLADRDHHHARVAAFVAATTLPLPIVSWTKENCSTVSPLRLKMRAFSSMPVLTSDHSL